MSKFVNWRWKKGKWKLGLNWIEGQHTDIHQRTDTPIHRQADMHTHTGNIKKVLFELNLLYYYKCPPVCLNHFRRNWFCSAHIQNKFWWRFDIILIILSVRLSVIRNVLFLVLFQSYSICIICKLKNLKTFVSLK